jgi:hypothetical protein
MVVMKKTLYQFLRASFLYKLENLLLFGLRKFVKVSQQEGKILGFKQERL